MAVETQYNVVKVNELREITVAQGVDELVINDLDSSPLETKKITAENLALSIKDYILPIATEDVLGGVKIGDGLTINPITGVLSNDILILGDLEDVIILNAEPGHIIRYNGTQWTNQPEGGITEVIAGLGLSGGGSEGDITLHVNAGAGLTIKNDQVTVNVHKGLQIVEDYIEVVLNAGLTISSNAITIVTGAGVVVDQSQVTLRLGSGLEFAGLDARVALDDDGLTYKLGKVALFTGKGLAFNSNKMEVAIEEDTGLEYKNLTGSTTGIKASKASYTQVGSSKFAPIVNNIADLRGTPSYDEDGVTPEFLDRVGSVPTGAIFYFAGRNVPSGYLFCDGREVSAATYPHLFSIIDTTYSQGNETAGFFRLPDLRDEFIRGATTTAATSPGTFRDRVVGSTESDQIKGHTHALDRNTAEAYVVTPGAFPTTSTSNFVWGFTMNNCTPPHRANPDGTFSLDQNGDHYFNFENETFDTNLVDTYADDSEIEIPTGCARVEFPVFFDGTTNSNRTTDVPDNDVDETRPRNIALLPCIKF